MAGSYFIFSPSELQTLSRASDISRIVSGSNASLERNGRMRHQVTRELAGILNQHHADAIALNPVEQGGEAGTALDAAPLTAGSLNQSTTASLPLTVPPYLMFRLKEPDRGMSYRSVRFYPAKHLILRPSPKCRRHFKAYATR